MNRSFALFVLWVTNIIDAMLTALGLQQGILIEVNPILNAAWHSHPLNFFVTKFALVGFFTFVAGCYWNDKRIRIFLHALNLFMIALVTYEMIGTYA